MNILKFNQSKTSLLKNLNTKYSGVLYSEVTKMAANEDRSFNDLVLELINILEPIEAECFVTQEDYIEVMKELRTRHPKELMDRLARHVQERASWIDHRDMTFRIN